MKEIKPFIRQAYFTLSDKFWGYLSSAGTKPLNSHIGFSPLRPLLNIAVNMMRSPAIMNVLRSPTGILACLGCVIAIAGISLNQRSQHGNAVNHAPQIPVTTRVEGGPSRERDVPLG